MMSLRRAWELSRLREVHTSAGQYAVGFLLLGELSLPAALGLAAAMGAGLFAFTYNTLMDFRGGQGLKAAGGAVLSLSDEDVRLSRFFCEAGLAVCLAGATALAVWTGRFAGPACLLLYCVVGYLYSSPAFRWKRVPGLECVSNGLAHALPFLAGYLQFGALDEAGALYALAWFLFMAGFYLLHCLEDAASDRAAGIRNLCAQMSSRQVVEGALAMTAISGVLLLAAGWFRPVLFLLVPFHVLAIRHEAALLGTGRIPRVNRIRKTGRLYGLVFFAVLVLRAVVEKWL
jgi:4-hydroxybenzoate polyprenyltransferase